MSDERFWCKVERTPTCWLWQAATSRAGYGMYRLGPGSMVSAHRHSYALAHGAIPDGRVIDHLCRVRACVNPAHLEAVTMQENARRGNLHPNGHGRKNGARALMGVTMTVQQMIEYLESQRDPDEAFTQEVFSAALRWQVEHGD